jgi:DNA-binding transcriptional regulator LsrR (DeoR family)
MLIHPFDLQGRFVSERLRELVIGFDARNLHRVPLTIGVAGGAEKVRPILGALRTGALSALVTDDETAREVLELDQATGATPTERRRAERRRERDRPDPGVAVASGT